MKNFKKIASAIAALSLAACVAVPMSATVFTASAANVETGKITIENSNAGHTYEAYQIFKGVLDVTDGKKTLTEVEWGTNVDSTNIVADLLNDETLKGLEGIKDLKSGATASDVATAIGKANIGSDSANAKALAKFFNAHLKEGEAAIATDSDVSDGYVLDVKTPGYYLVKDKDGTQKDQKDAYTEFILRVLDEETVNPKSDLPDVLKKVKESDGDTDSITPTVTFGKVADGDDGGSKANNAFNVGEGFSDVADYNIGDEVTFRLYGSLPENYDSYKTYKYVFHDTLGSEFSFDDTVENVWVWQNGDSSNPLVIDPDCYTVAGVTEGTETFTVTFDNLKEIKKDDGNPSETSGDAITLDEHSVIVVEYKATLTKDAKIGRPGQRNKVYLEFSNNPNVEGGGDTETGKTEENTVVVFTYEVDVTKVDGETSNKLGKAKFNLYYEDTVNHKRYYAKIATGADAGKFAGWTEVTGSSAGDDGAYTYDTSSLTDGSDYTYVLESAETTGLFTVKGIDEGTYKLEETEAPAGYNKLNQPMTLTITANTLDGSTSEVGSPDRQNWTVEEDGTKSLLELTATVSSPEFDGVTPSIDETKGKVSFDVANNQGAQLPSTGGIGTTLFYLGGGALVAVAGVMLITKKRMTKE